jgi:hypothetical protein
MTTIKASGSFVPYILALVDNHHMKVLEYLLSLRFNLHIGSMYVELETYFMNARYLGDNFDSKEHVLRYLYLDFKSIII